MPGDLEIPILLNRFQGVDLATDPSFVGNTVFNFCSNWIPSRAFLLERRTGSSAVASAYTPTAAPVSCPACLRAYSTAGLRQFFAAYNRVDGWDVVFRQTEGSISVLRSGSTTNLRHDLIQHGERVYHGNGTDPIAWFTTAGGVPTLNTLAALSSLSLTGSTAVIISVTTSAELPSGQYSYCWAVYNTSTKLYISRSSPVEITVPAGSFIRFGAPSTALSTNEIYQLFLTPRGLPIEYAQLQFPKGHTAGETNINVNSVAPGPPVPLVGTAVRTGNLLALHYNRLWISGDQTNSGLNKSNIYTTNILLPGNEQAVYDQRPFFPALAAISVQANDGDEITGIIPSSLRATVVDATAPLLIFKTASSWFWFGDILNDPSSRLVNLSSSVGCISGKTAVATLFGVIWCGLESVYLMRPDLQSPIDIGRSIRPAIAAIPPAYRSGCFAVYHKGFYKLFYPPAGGGTNTNQLWLDLRFGFNPSSPQWWGPHIGAPYSSAAICRRDAAEVDRAIAVRSTGTTFADEYLSQTGIFTEGSTLLTPILRTKIFDSSSPFDRKLFTRLRAIGRVASPLTLRLSIASEGSAFSGYDPLPFVGGGLFEWNTAEWENAEWGEDLFEESESIFSSSLRPRGRYIELEITSSSTVSIEIRDIELSYLPITRRVA